MIKHIKIIALVICLAALTAACGGGDGGGGSTSTPAAACSFEQFIIYTNYWGEWAARGIVKNTGNATAYWVRVTIDLYDANGTFLETLGCYVESTHIEQGQTSSFDNGFDSSTPASQVASYKWAITWR